MNDCNDISILPNYQNNCWLNAIIMAVLYSQYSRNLLINKSKEWIDDSYLNVIKEIIYAYYSNKKDIPFNKIDSSVLLYKLFKKNKSEWFEYYIIKFYKYLDINILDIAYLNDGSKDRYITKTQIDKNTNPDVIILFHQKLNEITSEYIKYLTYIKNSNKKLLNNYILPSDKISGISSYENEITYNGITYILTSCLSNNNIGYQYHSVAGLICNDTKYVYNGYKTTTNNPCNLIKYDWDINKNEDYCLNPNECEMNIKSNINKIKDLCFNFGSGNRTLVYVRKDKSLVNDTKIEMVEVKNSVETLNKTNINEIIEQIKNTSDLELLVQLEHIVKSKIELSKIKNGINRDLIEKKILQKKLSELNSKLELNETTKSSIKEPITEPITEPTTEPTTEPITEPNEEKLKGGKNITKKELINKINNKIIKLKKDKLINLYRNL